MEASADLQIGEIAPERLYRDDLKLFLAEIPSRSY